MTDEETEDVLRTEIARQMKPLLETWDARSRDMLDVLEHSESTRNQVVTATRSIRRSGWVSVGVLVLSVASMLSLLQAERLERAKFREAELLRRRAATQEMLDAMHMEATGLDRLIRAACPEHPPLAPSPD